MATCMLVECLAGKIFIIIIIIILDTVFMTKTQSRHSFDNLTIRVVDRAFRGLNNVSLWKHDDSLGSSSSLSLSLSLSLLSSCYGGFNLRLSNPLSHSHSQSILSFVFSFLFIYFLLLFA